MESKGGTTSDRSYSYTNEEKKGRYLFGDYSQFEEDKNIIHILKDFVSTSANIIEIHRNVDTARMVLENVDAFQDEITRKIESLRNSIVTSLDAFHTNYHERIEKSPDFNEDTQSSFFRMRAPLMDSIRDTEKQFIQYVDEYREEIQDKIIDSYKNAITLLQIWLSKDQYNLPETILGRRSKILTAQIDRDPYSYSITSTNEVIVNVEKSTSSETSVGGDDSQQAYTFSYHFTVNSKFSDFWKHRRKISDLGINNLMIPIGFKVSISDRIRRSFGFRSSQEDPQDFSEKEIESVQAGSLYITYVRIHTDRTLLVRFSADPSKSDEKAIEIEYDLPDLIPGEYNDASENARVEYYKGVISEGRLPRIDYVDKEERRRIDLTQKEFQKETDTLKIMIMGRVLSDRMNDISNTSTVSAYTSLDSIKVGDKDAVMVSKDQNKSLLYYEDLVISFLELVAVGFAPLIQTISDKSPVKGELILRYEADDVERKEFVVRREELSLPLSNDVGKRILEKLKL